MRLGVVQSTISKIETGKARAPEEVLLAWLDHTGVDDELRAELVELAKASTEVSDWPHLYARGWEAHQKSYSELERSASRELIFQNAVVPGLLQTAAYTSFLLTTVLGLSPEDVGVGVTSRLARQAVLYEPKTRIRAVVTEAVLRHRMGGPSVMPEQLARLAEVSTLPTVEFGIIPIDTAGAAVLQAFDSAETGQAWLLQAGRDVMTYRFRGIPGPLSETGERANPLDPTGVRID